MRWKRLCMLLESASAKPFRDTPPRGRLGAARFKRATVPVEGITLRDA
jgi:hypothetical protein